MLAIIAGIAAIAGILGAYAIVGAGIKDASNGIAVNEDKRGKGTVDTLSFKNPVTIRLIDKDGNVASETVVYNTITDGGKQYIYEVLSNTEINGDGSVGIQELNMIRFVDSDNGNETNSNVLTDGSTYISVVDGSVDCSAVYDSTDDVVECTGTFDISGTYTPSSNTSLNLPSDRSIQVGYYDGTAFTPYFELATFATSISATGGTTYSQIQITWTIEVS